MECCQRTHTHIQLHPPYLEGVGEFRLLSAVNNSIDDWCENPKEKCFHASQTFVPSSPISSRRESSKIYAN